MSLGRSESNLRPETPTWQAGTSTVTPPSQAASVTACTTDERPMTPLSRVAGSVPNRSSCRLLTPSRKSLAGINSSGSAEVVASTPSL